MRIERVPLSPNPYSRPGRRLERVAGLVVHYTGVQRQDALAVRNYFDALKSQPPGDSVVYASAHFAVGLAGEIVQCLPTDEMAYHVGAKLYTPEAVTRLGTYPNNCTIGVELCYRDSAGAFGTETWSAAIELFAWLAKTYQLNPTKDIWTHHGITGKLCPKWFVDHPEDFRRFQADVAHALAQKAEGDGYGTQR